MPIDLDVYVRKQRSKLVKIYLGQLRESIHDDQQKDEIKPVPLTVKVTKGIEGFTITTHALIDELVGTLRSPGHHRIAIWGDGGTGKTVIVQQLILRLIESGNVPMLLKAGGYGTEGENPQAESMDMWIVRTLRQARVPVGANVWRSLPRLVFVIDQASEVRQKLTGAFWKMVEAQSEAGAADVRMVVAGRDICDRATGAGMDLHWEEIVEPGELNDEDISAIGRAYLDHTGKSQEIKAFPQTIRGILPKPTAFLVSHYAKRLKAAVSPVRNQGQLFEAILEAYAGAGQLGTRPEIVKQVLENLVKWNFVILGRSHDGRNHDRGLPESQLLKEQVLEIFNGLRLKELYGEGQIPTPAGFVDKLVPSGLIYRLGGRYFFFHDLFEDWLAEETKDTPDLPCHVQARLSMTNNPPV